MNNALLQLKIKQRLNKLSSLDYDNIEPWQIQEAFNKAMIEWVRRQLHGNNVYKEGDEQSVKRIDDLQILLTPEKLDGKQFPTHFESEMLPADYMAFKRVSTQAVNDCCTEPRAMDVYLAEEADADLLYYDMHKGPNFEWGETFCTIFGNRLRIYTRPDFSLRNPKLIYYRLPRDVEFKGVINPETGGIYANDQPCEFKDDITELMIDEAAAILAGDIESMAQFQRGSQNAERNN
jgi:hypothetical protein